MGYEAVLINIVATIFIVGTGLAIIHRAMNNRCLTREEYEKDIEKKLQGCKEYVQTKMDMFSQLVDEKIAKVIIKLDMIEKYLKNQINRIEEKIEE